MRHRPRRPSFVGPPAVVVVVVVLLLGSTQPDAGAAPSKASRPTHARVTRANVAQWDPRTPDPAATTEGTDGSDSADAADSAGATGSVFLRPMVPRVDAEIAAVLENQRRTEIIAQTREAVAAEQKVADDAVEIHRQLVTSAGDDVTTARERVAELSSVLEDADERLDLAITESERQRARTVGVGVDMYVLSGTVADPRYQLLAALFNGADLQEPSTMLVYAEFASEASVVQLQRARRAVTDARTARERSATDLDDATDHLHDVQQALDSAQRELDQATRNAEEVRRDGARRVVLAEQSAPLLPPTQMAGGLTIVGEPLVSAADMAGFAREVGRSHPSIDLDELAATFIAEGRAEHIRSDVAWVQSILETGWFSFQGSMVHPTDNNFAGIGACDTCTRGIVFASPVDGVRTQIQLLRTYATKGLRTSDLANPPPRLEPERSSVRGCCDTWMKLSGVWATGPGYGLRILTLYNQLLTYAASIDRR